MGAEPRRGRGWEARGESVWAFCARMRDSSEAMRVMCVREPREPGRVKGEAGLSGDEAKLRAERERELGVRV